MRNKIDIQYLKDNHLKLTNNDLKNSKKFFLSINENNFSIDKKLYSYLYGVDEKEVNKDVYNNGIINNKIYNLKQLQNLYGNHLKFEHNDNLKNFVKKNVDEKHINDFYDMIEIKENKLNNEKLIILLFIGNEEIGLNLLKKIINYKYTFKQDFILSICFKNEYIYNKLKNKIVKIFDNYCLFITKELGFDIMPTLMMYEKIKHLVDFEYLIKLHTKSNKKILNKCSDYLLSKNLNELKKMFIDNCNCVSEPSTMIKLDDVNFLLQKKYEKYMNLNKYFNAYTIFFTQKIIFDKINEFIKNNNLKSLFLNNMYYLNSINYGNSLIHFIERLFGVIKLN